jgi:glycosyltransferase involved in cell wall biosynthesis
LKNPSQLKILWLKTGPLHPLDTGGKIRTCNMLRELKKRHFITYLALCQSAQDRVCLEAAKEYSNEQIWIPWQETPKRTLRFYGEVAANLFSARPYTIDKYRSQAMAAKIKELDAAAQHDLIVCDFLTPSVNLRDAGRLKTPVLLFQHNVESQIWERLAQNASGLARIYFRSQWRRMETFERESCSLAQAVAGVSEDDCRMMREKFTLTNVVGAVPTGVDLDYFSGVAKGLKQSRSLVFLGSMDWMPNIDAAKFFVQEILPLIKRKFSDVKVVIVGRNPSPAVKELEQRTDGVHVTGTVDDVRPYLAEAALMIVPLRVGGGTRIKIYEGMAAGLPVVSTTIGAEGLPLVDGREVFLADDPAHFADRVCQLLEDEGLRLRLAGNGLELVRRNFSWEAATRVFEGYCQKLVGG